MHYDDDEISRTGPGFDVPPPAPRRPRRGPGMPVLVGAGVALAVIAGLIVALVVVLNGRSSSSSAPAVDPTVNAEACRAYDNALKDMHELLTADSKMLFLLANEAPTAKSRVSTAAQLAQGPTRTAMERTATYVQIFGDKEKLWGADNFDDSTEIAGMRSAVAAVKPLCSQAGVNLSSTLGG